MINSITKIKGAGHQPLTKQIAKDWRAMFKLHPQAFQGIICTTVEKSEQNNEDVEVPLFGQLNDHQDAIEFNDPELVSIIQVKNGDLTNYVSDDDGLSLGMGESETFKCRLSTEVVPVGSAIVYDETVGDRIIRRWWTVLSVSDVAYAHFSAAKLYICVPMDNPEIVFKGVL